MARKITPKQKEFAEAIADGATGVEAALKVYEVKSHKDDEASARAIASQNLTKPIVLQYLEELGFSEENADRVVAEILNNKHEEGSTRLSAADKIYKRMGSYAAEKSFNLTTTATVDELKSIIQQDLAKFRPNK
jgi:hypothetical protein